MASYHAFLSSVESRTLEKPGIAKQHSPFGLRLPKTNVSPLLLRAPAYDSEARTLAELVAHAGGELVGERRRRVVVDQEDLGVPRAAAAR